MVQVILTSCKVLRMVMLIGIQLYSICIYIYISIFICMLCYKDQLGDFTYIYV